MDTEDKRGHASPAYAHGPTARDTYVIMHFQTACGWNKYWI